MKLFDRSKLTLKPISERISDISVEDFYNLDSKFGYLENENLDKITHAIKKAKENNRPIIMFMGGHVIRSGTQCFIKDMIDKGYITHLAGNGAVAIHDFELAMIGKTTESVERYLKTGEFGMWYETSKINEIIYSSSNFFKFESYYESLGYGECLGWYLNCGIDSIPTNSLLYHSFVKKIPFTIHIGIGYDILCECPNYDGAVSGKLSYNDFLCFVNTVCDLQDGVFLNFGSSVAGTEIFLKALAMARNAKYKVDDFTVGVFDIMPISENKPEKKDWQYYVRWNKTLLHRVSDKAYYVQGKHEMTIPNLWSRLCK